MMMAVGIEQGEQIWNGFNEVLFAKSVDTV